MIESQKYLTSRVDGG